MSEDLVQLVVYIVIRVKLYGYLILLCMAPDDPKVEPNAHDSSESRFIPYEIKSNGNASLDAGIAI